MPTTLTPVAVWPSDFTEVAAGDAANGINEPGHTQKLVNALAALKLKTDNLISARFELAASGIAADAEATISTLFASAGVSIVSNKVRLPIGTYFVAVNATITSSSTSDPTIAGLIARRGSSTSLEHNAIGNGHRASASAGGFFQTNAFGLIQVTSATTHDIAVLATSGGGADVTIVVGSLNIIGIPT